LIGIFADSNGDLGAFGAALKLLHQKGARRFFFPGGRYTDLDEWMFARPPALAQADGGSSDAEELDRLKERFVRAPERESIHYGRPAVGTKVVDMLGDVLCCIVHDKNDLDRDDLLNASVFFHGKGPEPKVVQIGPRYFVTPGQLSGAAAQTCALIELVDRNLRFSAFRLDGLSVIDGQLLELPRKSKLSVK
jgi:hypothetical protein